MRVCLFIIVCLFVHCCMFVFYLLFVLSNIFSSFFVYLFFSIKTTKINFASKLKSFGNGLEASANARTNVLFIVLRFLVFCCCFFLSYIFVFIFYFFFFSFFFLLYSFLINSSRSVTFHCFGLFFPLKYFYCFKLSRC